METFDVKPDYVNGQFHAWQDGRQIEIKLPAELQAAMMKQVISDCSYVFKQAIKNQLSDVPPGIEAMIPH